MPFGSLWLAVLVSTVAVVVVSFIVCMIWHRSDFKRLPDEDAVLDALRKQSAESGMYMLPYCGSAERKDPAAEEKRKRGPVGVLMVMASDFNMGAVLGLSVLHCFLISFLTAYVLRHAGLSPGASWQPVLRIALAVGVVGHTVSQMPLSIYKGQPWSVTVKTMVDGVLYALVTAVVFCWLWPKA